MRRFEVLAQEREDLHARRQAGQELVEQAEGGIGVGLLLERAEERGRELGEELARPRAAGGADVAVVPGPHAGGDGGRVLEAHAGEGGDRARIVLRAGEDEAAAGPEVGLALEEGGVVALDRGEGEEDGLLQGVGVGEAGEGGEALELALAIGQGLGLLVGHHLQPMLQRPQQAVGVGQLQGGTVRRPSGAGPGRRVRHRSAAGAARASCHPG